MAERDEESDRVFRGIAATYRGPEYEVKRMFGSDGLMVDGRLACFVDREGRLVAKLPEAAMRRLQVARLGEPMVMRGRPMREWFAVKRTPKADWAAVAAEAVRFVRDRD